MRRAVVPPERLDALREELRADALRAEALREELLRDEPLRVDDLRDPLDLLEELRPLDPDPDPLLVSAICRLSSRPFPNPPRAL